MSQWSDERYIQQRVEALQRDLDLVKKQALPFLAHQRGPIPGVMRAVTIGDVGMKSSMWLNLNGQQTGQAPYQAVTDASGVVRYEAGNLAANGVSAGHYGWRVNDGGGVPIADAIGLSQVMSQLGHKDSTSASSYTTTTPTVVSAGGTTASITFSLVRQARVLAVYNIVGFSQTLLGLIDLFVDGVNKSSAGWPDVAFGANTPTETGVSYYSEALSAGSHTIDIRGYLQGTPPGTLTVATFDLIVWLLGT